MLVFVKPKNYDLEYRGLSITSQNIDMKPKKSIRKIEINHWDTHTVKKKNCDISSQIQSDENLADTFTTSLLQKFVIILNCIISKISSDVLMSGCMIRSFLLIMFSF